jgi:hypothetical protein
MGFFVLCASGGLNFTSLASGVAAYGGNWKRIFARDKALIIPPQRADTVATNFGVRRSRGDVWTMLVLSAGAVSRRTEHLFFK